MGAEADENAHCRPPLLGISIGLCSCAHACGCARRQRKGGNHNRARGCEPKETIDGSEPLELSIPDSIGDCKVSAGAIASCPHPGRRQCTPQGGKPAAALRSVGVAAGALILTCCGWLKWDSLSMSGRLEPWKRIRYPGMCPGRRESQQRVRCAYQLGPGPEIASPPVAPTAVACRNWPRFQYGRASDRHLNLTHDLFKDYIRTHPEGGDP